MAHVTGIDFIPQAIAHVAHQSKRDRLDFRVMDMSRLDFSPASFDVVVSVDTFYFHRPRRDAGRLPVLLAEAADWPPSSTRAAGRTRRWSSIRASASCPTTLTWRGRCGNWAGPIAVGLQRRHAGSPAPPPACVGSPSRFEAEGNLFLYDSHLGESHGIERAYSITPGSAICTWLSVPLGQWARQSYPF
ncbi:class I SAM-dependent methyltransferase [Candidatus Amarolinea aalborgensis]|uniref:class I SAM-dependent methyltransferase n=1 Tax=Candidatus Amarolinea aalborgensis TaxID=2249329 RepID=UPI003BF9C45C